MLKNYGDDEKVNPGVLKKTLVSRLASVIPQEEQEKIIHEVFSKPNSRYTAHLAKVNAEFSFSEEELTTKIKTYNDQSVFSEEEFEKSTKYSLELKDTSNVETVIVFSSITRKPQFDIETMISNPVTYHQRVRVLIKHDTKRVIVYTGDRDIFNNVLTVLTIALESAITPLDSNKTGITNMEKGSFSFDTVKFIDFIYNGLTSVGTLSQVNQIELESIKTSKQTQKVTVQGDMLLNDKSICRYLFIHARDLVGIKGVLRIDINDVEYSISFEIGLRNNRVKLGIKKDRYSIEELKMFFTLIEETFYENIAKPGLINRAVTSAKLDEIRAAALRED